MRLEDIRVPHVEPEPRAAEPPASDGPVFAIERFEVTGNTLLTTSQVERALEPFRGEERTLADVEKARDALQRLYEADGFLTVAVAIPQQTIESGAVRLDVVEARVGRVTVQNEGVRWMSDRRVLRSMENTVPGAVLREEDLQQDLVRANRTRDALVRPQLAAGRAPAEVDVALLVEDRIPLHGTLAWHNEYTPGSPDTRMDASISYADLWGLGHEAGVFYQFVPTAEFNDVQIWAGTYRMPLPWSEKQQLFAYYAASDTTNAAATGASLSILGKGTTAGLRYVVSLPAIPGWERFSHDVTVGVDYKDVENAVVASAAEIVTPIKYLPFNVAWSGTRLGDHAITTARLGASFHFAGTLADGGKTDFQINRGGVDPDSDVTGTYQIATLALSQTLRVPSILRTLAAGRFVALATPEKSFLDDWTFELRARGQVADQPLIATEQFGAGGMDTVRGYLDRERFGDNGYALQLELRTPSYRNFLGGRLRERVQVATFWDNAEQWLYEDPVSPRIPSRLASYGVGVRAGFFEALTTELTLAQPLIDTDDSSGPRLNFRLALGF